ncbi:MULTISPECIES: rod shape-determining protein MreD [unclassified Lysobacter]|uniref:rod shape-determining protein MreD n=1 Tax=unclassified Lysobacter TaxID=2635362 RepID=UPI001C24C147|nr:rod shape-determining protein MreD [Lysobacter sp. MMG2]MBU8975935.1 rod shape-determining protein MreD [Lysobacter sp. MMG2]
MSRVRPQWVLPLSIVVALMLGLLPLPPALQPLRPFWLALVLAYWVIEDPDHVGLGVAFIVGLLGDLVYGSLFGEHALRLVVMAYILQRFRARLRFFPMSQQALAIGGLLLNDCIVIAAIHLAVGERTPLPLTWLSPLTGLLLWPLVYVGLDSLRHGRWRAR